MSIMGVALFYGRKLVTALRTGAPQSKNALIHKIQKCVLAFAVLLLLQSLLNVISAAVPESREVISALYVIVEILAVAVCFYLCHLKKPVKKSTTSKHSRTHVRTGATRSARASRSTGTRGKPSRSHRRVESAKVTPRLSSDHDHRHHRHHRHQ